MRQEHPAWVEHQRKRWMRPDAERWWRGDAARFMTPEAARELLPESMQLHERKDDRAPTPAIASGAQQAREERQRRTEILRLKSQIAALRFQRALVLYMIQLQRKANFNPNQPRVPSGIPTGGQWTRDGGGGRINDPRVVSDATPDNTWVPGAQYAERRRPGIGHNQGPPLDTPAEVPTRRPVSGTERNLIAKRVARGRGGIGAFIRAAAWLREFEAEIKSYRDPPRTLEELQQAARHRSIPGYQDHHIVGQAARWEDDDDRRFPASRIDADDNIARIPTFRHREISTWYQQRNNAPPFNGLTPRAHLRGKEWGERYQIGLDALREFGVLRR